MAEGVHRVLDFYTRLLGVLDPDLLVLRLAETGVGALGAALAVILVLPVTTGPEGRSPGG
ncbi:hypothetical protein ACWD0Z_26725 [Streptomyces sp. NPDC003007]